MEKKLLIFDLDGTLLDTIEDLADAVNYALAGCGLPRRELGEVRQFVGNGIKNLIKRAVPQGTPDAVRDRVFEIFMGYYGGHCADKTVPYPGMQDCLEKLKREGFLLAVVSNKADSAVQKLCGIFFKDVFDFVSGEREGARKKPAPDLVLLAMEKFDMPPERTIYIGDSDVDIETAANAGLDCVSVTWGFRGRDFLKEHGASDFADTVEDLWRMVWTI